MMRVRVDLFIVPGIVLLPDGALCGLLLFLRAMRRTRAPSISTGTTAGERSFCGMEKGSRWWPEEAPAP